jgi:hypothetical protein
MTGFDFSEHQFLSYERHSQSEKHARALEFFLQRWWVVSVTRTLVHAEATKMLTFFR